MLFGNLYEQLPPAPLQENRPTALLGRSANAPYERFATGKTSAQAEFTAQPLAALPPYGCDVPLEGASAEHLKYQRVAAVKGRRNKIKRTSFRMVPIGTFFEPGELSGTEADGGSRPPLCFHANNRMISSFSVICFAMCGAWSPSRIGVSRAPMSR